jgi:hypothetical protein
LCRAVLVAVATAVAFGSPQSLDCPLRQIGLDYAQQLQPWRPLSAFQQVADALNGAQEAQNCSVAPTVTVASRMAPRIPIFPVPKTGYVVYADPSPLRGSDVTGDGSLARPFLSVERALAAVRSKRARIGPAALPSSIVLRAGELALTRASLLQTSTTALPSKPPRPLWFPQARSTCSRRCSLHRMTRF